MPTQLPRKVAAGEPITASGWNALVELVGRLLAIRGLHPVRVDQRATGVVISLDRPPQRRFEATITQVNGGAGPALASTFTYSVRLLDRREAGGAGGDGLLTNLTPKFRPNRDSIEIWPATVGDPCQVVYREKSDGSPDVMLILEPNSEVTAWGSCT